MKFKLIKEIDGECGAYGVEGLKTGDVFDLDGYLAEKASNNPDFEVVNDGNSNPSKRKGVKKARR